MSDIAQLEPSSRGNASAKDDERRRRGSPMRRRSSQRVGARQKRLVSSCCKTLGAMSPDERKVQGPAINGLKDRVTEALAARRDVLKGRTSMRRLATETVDVTLPVREAPIETGRIHPVSQVIDELTAIFADLGFTIAEGPDIETDYYNFTTLNFPDGHPAREMHDTFFFTAKADGERMLLRTHTSPVQVRTMLRRRSRRSA